MNDATEVAAWQPLPPPAIENELVRDMPAELYFSIESLSQSGAKVLRQSPMHYLFERTHRKPPSDAMLFGTSVHDGVLEPDTYGARVAAVPDDAPKRPTSAQLNAKKPSPETVAAIAYWQELDAASAGKIVLSAKDYARSRACIEAVRSHPSARRLLDGGDVELSLFWQDRQYGVPCKARWDCANRGGIVDVKTTTDASPEAFGKSIANFEYHAQGAHYISGAEHVLNESPKFFAFIAVESEPPHAVACYYLDSDAILAGQHLMAIALERYAEARATGQWKGYPLTIDRIQLPRWALRFAA